MKVTQPLPREYRILLSQFQERIDGKIEQYLQELGESSELVAAITTALRGGKRFRPALVFLVADALGKGLDPTYAALSVEFFHTASLVVDDLPCMDNDDERRGKPAVHAVYGEAVALLVTYALISEGYHCLIRGSDQVGEKQRLIAIDNVSRNTGIKGATGGQLIDLFPPDMSAKTLEEVIYKKTVSLFEIAFVLGWIYGGGELDALTRVKEAAARYGMAFQITDDFEDEAQDMANGCQVNMAIQMGRNAAYGRFIEEIDGYRCALSELGIASPPLLALAEALKQKVEALR